jgi:SAM-dependent MidA family methyltransferase
MCHIQHRAHDNPFFALGLQDITAHVDFTAVAHAATEHGLELLGYTSQARFLMNAGIANELQHAAKGLSPRELTQTNQAIQKLLSEAEMGELFKVLVVGRGMDHPLSGFSRGDRSHQLISESTD